MSMSVEHLRYELQNGYIHTWLTVGPQIIPAGEETDLATPPIQVSARLRGVDVEA